MDGLGDTFDYITNNCTNMVIQHIYGEKPLYLGNERNKKGPLVPDLIYGSWRVLICLPKTYLNICGVTLLVYVAICIFGPRVSNLDNKGIII